MLQRFRRAILINQGVDSPKVKKGEPGGPGRLPECVPRSSVIRGQSKVSSWGGTDTGTIDSDCEGTTLPVGREAVTVKKQMQRDTRWINLAVTYAKGSLAALLHAAVVIANHSIK